MAGAAISLDLSGFKLAEDKLERLRTFDHGRLLQILAPIVETQTRRRIELEKTAPDGTPWPAWSPKYAAERPAGKSLLEDSGGLLDSIVGEVSGDELAVGSNKEYARIHQLGGKTKPHVIKAEAGKALKVPGVGFRKSVKHPGSVIPAREFLGVSEENAVEIQDEALAFLADLLQ